MDELFEVYRGIEIWWRPAIGRFTAQVATGYLATSPSLSEIKVLIDEILAFLEPPEDPADGLFAQVVAALQVWVNGVIGDRLQPVYDWIDNVFAGAGDYADYLFADAGTLITNVSGALTSLATTVGDRWDTFTTLTLPSIWDGITAMGADWAAALDQARVDTNAFIDTKFRDYTAWVLDLFTVMDPQGVLKDPLGYIGTAFNTLINPWAHGIIKSFWEGFEEGQEE